MSTPIQSGQRVARNPEAYACVDLDEDLQAILSLAQMVWERLSPAQKSALRRSFGEGVLSTTHARVISNLRRRGLLGADGRYTLLGKLVREAGLHVTVNPRGKSE